MLTHADITETLGREVDEIEDIRRYFERSYGGSCSDPTDGDFISDDYYKIIDLTTKPTLNQKEVQALNRSIEHLNHVYPTIERRLGRAGLLETYRDVATQINTINAQDDTRRNEVAGLLAALPEASESISHQPTIR